MPIAIEPLRAFISYSYVDRDLAAQVKTVLQSVQINAFMAHEDIDVSEAWRERILSELKCCRVFIPIISANFRASDWTAQEVGFIASRDNVAIAPLLADAEVPFGFISHVQGRRFRNGQITRDELVVPLARSLPRLILPRLIQFLSSPGDFRNAEARMGPLVPFFAELTPDEAQALARVSLENGQVWNAGLCRKEYLPELIRLQSPNIEATTLEALRFQIEYEQWYPREPKG